MTKVLITTVPFSDKNNLPIDLLVKAGIEFHINPIGRKLKENELADIISEFDILIAGTEAITAKVIERATRLRLISRVGIGLDGVDLLAAKQRNILVSYTPEAPAPAVAELTLGLMLSLLRSIHISNSNMHNGIWNRYFGRRLSDVTIGIIGAGRIGGRVLKSLIQLGQTNILVNDINKNLILDNADSKLKIVDKEVIYRKSDLISLHLPLTSLTRDMIKYDELKMMKSDALIINTSRGGIINEDDLARAMFEGHLGGAAIDVFENEPYSGNLQNIERCLLTSHMGSMSFDCRARMEIEATQEAIRFIEGKKLKSLVPENEYEVRKINF